MTIRRRRIEPPVVAVTALAGLLLAAVAACGSGGGGGAGAVPGAVEASPGVSRAPAVRGAPVAELAAGFNDAGFDLLRTQPDDTNLVFSPVSIGHALLMARAAADEETGAAIDAAFGLPPGPAAHDAWNTLDLAVAASTGVATAADGSKLPVVRVAGRLWPSSSAAPSQEWVDLLASHHGVEVETIDVSQPEPSRARINGWVGEQTDGLIPELLPAGFIGPQTVLVLIDAVYFKAQWRTIFGKYGPTRAPFTRLDAFLAGAVHGADITVDEVGTVAAAATALGFDESGPPEPERVVAVDKPFLYLIRHRPTGTVLFAGQVTDPTA